MIPGFSVVIVATLPSGRYGVMRWDSTPFAVTLERTFDDQRAPGGQRVVIPYGPVPCVRDFYHAGGYETFELKVSGHSRVLFHKLNVETQSEACMGIGESFVEFNEAKLKGPGIGQSGAGFDEFMRRAAGMKAFTLTVLERADA